MNITINLVYSQLYLAEYTSYLFLCQVWKTSRHPLIVHLIILVVLFSLNFIGYKKLVQHFDNRGNFKTILKNMFHSFEIIMICLILAI